MKKIILTLTLVLTFAFTVVANAEAGDMLFRITHNDHDVLVVGTITSIDEQKIKADVNATIVSTAYMNQIDKKIQLNPAHVTIDISNLKLFNDYKAGDYILASLDKTLFDYRVANGLYKVDSTDIKTLKIVTDGEKNGDIIALEYFINSNGTINEFTFESDTIKFIDPNGEEIILYDKTDEAYNETLLLEDQTTLEQVKAKEYDDAMVVTILLTTGIMIVIILMKFRTKTND